MTSKKGTEIKGLQVLSPKDIRVFHKLGSGGFGTVRLAKIRVNSEVSDACKSDGASTQEDSDCSHDST